MRERHILLERGPRVHFSVLVNLRLPSTSEFAGCVYDQRSCAAAQIDGWPDFCGFVNQPWVRVIKLLLNSPPPSIMTVLCAHSALRGGRNIWRAKPVFRQLTRGYATSSEEVNTQVLGPIFYTDNADFIVETDRAVRLSH